MSGDHQRSPQENLFDPILRQENHIEPDGRYKYGFQSNVAARDEIRGKDGITRGYFAFIDDQGEMQYVFYTAGNDGFKVQAISNMKSVLPTSAPTFARTSSPATSLIDSYLAVAKQNDRNIHFPSPIPSTPIQNPNGNDYFEALKNLRFEQVGETKLQHQHPIVARFNRNLAPASPPLSFSSNINLFGGEVLGGVELNNNNNRQQPYFGTNIVPTELNPDANSLNLQQEIVATPVKPAEHITYPLDIGINLFSGEKLKTNHILSNYNLNNDFFKQSKSHRFI